MISNNSLILLFLIVVVICFGDKFIPKKLLKYKKYIISLLILILIYLVCQNKEYFEVNGRIFHSAGDCVAQQQDDYHNNEDSEIYNDIDKLHDSIDNCKHEYLNQVRARRQAEEGSSESPHHVTHDHAWCTNPDNIIEGNYCYTCHRSLPGNKVSKDPDDPYHGECFRCGNGYGPDGRYGKVWRSTSCPRDPNQQRHHYYHQPRHHYYHQPTHTSSSSINTSCSWLDSLRGKCSRHNPN